MVTSSFQAVVETDLCPIEHRLVHLGHIKSLLNGHALRSKQNIVAIN